MTTEDFDDSFTSKTAIKREAERLKKIGEKLLALPPETVQGFPIPEILNQALTEGRRIKSREGLRRHKQYIGKLLRELDTEAIEFQIHHLESAKTLNTRQFHELEQLRDQLIQGDNNTIGDAIAAFPNVDTQKLRQLVRNAKKTPDDVSHSRKLFRYLRDLRENQTLE